MLFTAYNVKDCLCTSLLHSQMYNANLDAQIAKLYKKISFYDDASMTRVILRKIYRLKQKKI